MTQKALSIQPKNSEKFETGTNGTGIFWERFHKNPEIDEFPKSKLFDGKFRKSQMKLKFPFRNFRKCPYTSPRLSSFPGIPEFATGNFRKCKPEFSWFFRFSREEENLTRQTFDNFWPGIFGAFEFPTVLFWIAEIQRFLVFPEIFPGNFRFQLYFLRFLNYQS